MLSTLFSKPKNIFLIDSIGALVTACSLYFVLKPLNEYIGMPEGYYFWLSLIAFLFFVYSAICYFSFNEPHWKKRLMIISIANLSYCILTATLILLHFSSFTLLGICYFVGEILIVSSLAFVEWRMVKAGKQ